jgi:hypothetical protein
MHILDGVVRNIYPESCHVSLPQRFDQEAHSAAGVQDSAGVNVANYSIGNPAKETQPVVIVLIRCAAPVSIIVSII